MYDTIIKNQNMSSEHKGERRDSRRFSLKLACRIKSETESSMISMLSNISENGLFVRTGRNFTSGSTVEIEIMMPEGQVSYLKGVIRRIIHEPDGHFKYGLGIELLLRDKNFSELYQEILLSQNK